MIVPNMSLVIRLLIEPYITARVRSYGFVDCRVPPQQTLGRECCIASLTLVVSLFHFVHGFNVSLQKYQAHNRFRTKLTFVGLGSDSAGWLRSRSLLCHHATVGRFILLLRRLTINDSFVDAQEVRPKTP